MAEIDYRTVNFAAHSPTDTVNRAEREYHSKIKELARRISKNENIKIILLAGPSGSGKTTSANLLSDALAALGEQSLVISLDNFYKDALDPTYPVLANGERDYECPESLDLISLGEMLVRASEGKEFEIPRYDFKSSKRLGVQKHAPISHGCLVIEGLHALNPIISSSLPREKVLKIFVSVSTNINDGEERILSGKKLRFIRRLVRDSLYRGTDAEKTLEMWRNVLHSEEIYLYPYKSTADVAFDTFHIFEPCVMAPFAKKLITRELAEKNGYAGTVYRAIELITPIDAHLVPENSLIKEFIPGGIYESLY